MILQDNFAVYVDDIPVFVTMNRKSAENKLDEIKRLYPNNKVYLCHWYD